LCFDSYTILSPFGIEYGSSHLKLISAGSVILNL
jgi:hypothetical protein